MATYTFGDDTPALRRLELVARAYEPTTAAFIAEQASRRSPPHTVVDIGCGPGFTTALLARELTPQRLIGIDASAQFLNVARTQVPDARFEHHDATATPLPGTPADLIYARLVLAHLPDPHGTLELWKTGLGPNSVLLVEDLQEIAAPAGALRTYDQLSADIVAQGGGVMYAGAMLTGLGGQLVPVTVPAATAATIYLFNVDRWLDDHTTPLPHEQLLELRHNLERLTHHDHRETVTWTIRQLALAT